jgi:hypothetical protein
VDPGNAAQALGASGHWSALARARRQADEGAADAGARVEQCARGGAEAWARGIGARGRC